jgi:hypothetical protein
MREELKRNLQDLPLEELRMLMALLIEDSGRKGTVNVPHQSPELEHTAVAKAMSLRLSAVVLQDYKLHGKIVWKHASKTLRINSTHRLQGTSDGAAAEYSSFPRCCNRCV